ncbi:MAG: spore coat protein [Lachnospiraceae bacterium]|jgi:spore coat protein CotF|nr:spore coat protein [Lachnospiraceae bacterium]MDE7057802.1 spore coat protein [Lachnospiraceae bacterium]
MDEKTMVSDALVGINGELKMYAEFITQSENPQLKQTLKQMRNKAETAQEQLYQIAREKSYYVPAAKATKEEIEHVKSLFKAESML